MLILTKAILALMLGFFFSLIAGLVLIPWLKKMKAGQRISIYLAQAHKKKSGTPTMGGLIFIIPTIITTIILLITKKIEFGWNLGIVLFVMVAYSLIGFIDDYLKIKRNNNDGLTEVQKLFGQIIIAMVFFFLYMKSGAEPLLWFHTFGIKINIGWLYGFFILFLLVGSSNAVNITDGLDGLSGGLSAIAFLVFGMIVWHSGWLDGYESIAVFCFVLTGAILGFLVFNSHPAKVIMGDTGSLALGGVLATVAILCRHEITLVVVAGVFVIETLSVIIQIASLRLRRKKVFLMTPLHHHFEKLGWKETDIVKLFWVIGFFLGALALIFANWI